MKYMKMAAIAMMALALFSCNKKDEPKKAENAVLRICINDAELRALGDAYKTGDQTTCMTEVNLILDNGAKIELKGQQLTEAKSSTGCMIPVTYAVNSVALTANGVVGDDTSITTLQGKNLKEEIPLEAKATATSTTTANGQTVYSVTLKPVPHVARVEVFGKIEGQPNSAGKNAFKSITVKQVYVNNYLDKRNDATRTLCLTNGTNGFATAPVAAMTDEIKDGDLADFVAGKKVAGYQLFPKKADEVATAELYDHVIVKIQIEYSEDAIKAKPELKNMTERYVTMVKFMTAATGDLDHFESGKIYKLNLGELSQDFKTGDDGTPDPNNPDTPDPEPNAKRFLKVIVEPYTWTAVNIKPDVNGGYKK